MSLLAKTVRLYMSPNTHQFYTEDLKTDMTINNHIDGLLQTALSWNQAYNLRLNQP